MQLAKRKTALLALALATIASTASASRTDVDGELLRDPRVASVQLEAPRFALALERSVSVDLALPELATESLEPRLDLERWDSKPHVRAFDLALEKQPQATQRFSLEIASGAWETGLLYARNRFYDPELGRFISADPLGYVDGPNVYAYAKNNPLFFTDPMGLEAMVTVTADGKKVEEQEITGDDLQKMLLAEGLSAKEASRIVIEAGMGQDIGADKTKALTPNILAAGTVIEDVTKVGTVVWGAPALAAAAAAAPSVIAAAKGACLLNAIACTEVVVGGVGAVMGIEGPDPVTALSPGAVARGARTGGQFLEEVLPMAARTPGWRPAMRAAAGAQNHHLISNPIADALEQVGLSSETVKALRGNPALQKMSIPGGHVGYEDWHRAYDDYMVNYIQAKGPANFNVSDFFREVESYYATGEAARRIPAVSLANP